MDDEEAKNYPYFHRCGRGGNVKKSNYYLGSSETQDKGKKLSLSEAYNLMVVNSRKLRINSGFLRQVRLFCVD